MFREDVASLVEWEIDYFKYKIVVQKLPNMIISMMVMMMMMKRHKTSSMMM